MFHFLAFEIVNIPFHWAAVRDLRSKRSLWDWGHSSMGKVFACLSIPSTSVKAGSGPVSVSSAEEWRQETPWSLLASQSSWKSELQLQ